MAYIVCPPYDSIILGGVETCIVDHIGGFDSSLRCQILDQLSAKSVTPGHRVLSEYIFSSDIRKNYPDLELCFDIQLWKKYNFVESFKDYTIHPDLTFQNFLCSFNGSSHVSRKLLVAILHRFGYFDSEYCSKNFTFSVDVLDGHIGTYVDDRLYRKFFILSDSDKFFNSSYSFGHVKFNHANNIYNLESKLTQSFLHIVSETMATSYYPFVTEKFLYSIVTRGLFLSYAQPGWHAHLEKYYGFKLYTKLFDYRFDTIQNPVKRLVELMSMISKFSVLSTADWRELYLIQQDEIEYNYNHYFSGRYLTHLKQYE
jgi:hypothetical protein